MRIFVFLGLIFLPATNSLAMLSGRDASKDFTHVAKIVQARLLQEMEDQEEKGNNDWRFVQIESISCKDIIDMAVSGTFVTNFSKIKKRIYEIRASTLYRNENSESKLGYIIIVENAAGSNDFSINIRLHSSGIGSYNARKFGGDFVDITEIAETCRTRLLLKADSSKSNKLTDAFVCSVICNQFDYELTALYIRSDAKHHGQKDKCILKEEADIIIKIKKQAILLLLLGAAGEKSNFSLFPKEIIKAIVQDLINIGSAEKMDRQAFTDIGQ